MKTLSKILLFTLLTTISFVSCNSQQNTKQEQHEAPKQLTPIQEIAKQRLTKLFPKLGIKYFTGDEVSKLAEELVNISITAPEQLIPMMSYYDYFNEDLGVHYNLKNWDKLQFYKDIDLGDEAFYETNYKFVAMDETTILQWRLVGHLYEGKINREKLGGRIELISTELTCLDGLTMKFYLENKETVFLPIDDQLTCDLATGFGGSLNYSDLERLSVSELKAVEIFENEGGTSITFAIDNPYMKKYFQELKKEFDNNLKNR
ncbi:hypothetical protein G5B10_00765 [Fluviicola sp. SGL-29]|nr:hypothetical protein [Fluviicola sp. SGL-29]